MVDTTNIRQKRKRTGVTFRTFGVEHYVLKENMVPYKKKYVKVPNFIINKTYHVGHFLWDMRRHSEMQ
jgi:hypothetical protein